MTTRIVAPTRDRRPLWNAGANRGARLGLAAIQQFNRASTRFELVPTYVDPVPSRGQALAAEARSRGIDATGEEDRIEDFVARRPERDVPILLNIDSAAGVARVLAAVGRTAPAIFVYQILETPDRRVSGMSVLLRREDDALREQAVRFFTRLGELTERSGADAILGPTGNVAARAMESQLRRYFAAHAVKNLGKVLAGLESESPAFEVSNGIDVSPLYVRETDGNVEPARIAAQVADDPEHPMRRGTSFTVAEVTPNGEVRMHVARRRSVDDDVRVRERGLLEQGVMDRSVAEGEAQRRAAEEEAARRAVRPDTELSKLLAQVLVPRAAVSNRPQMLTLSARTPIRTTD